MQIKKRIKNIDNYIFLEKLLEENLNKENKIEILITINDNLIKNIEIFIKNKKNKNLIKEYLTFAENLEEILIIFFEKIIKKIVNSNKIEEKLNIINKLNNINNYIKILPLFIKKRKLKGHFSILINYDLEFEFYFNKEIIKNDELFLFIYNGKIKNKNIKIVTNDIKYLFLKEENLKN